MSFLTGRSCKYYDVAICLVMNLDWQIRSLFAVLAVGRSGQGEFAAISERPDYREAGAAFQTVSGCDPIQKL